jgi:Glucodextranase, domain B
MGCLATHPVEPGSADDRSLPLLRTLDEQDLGAPLDSDPMSAALAAVLTAFLAGPFDSDPPLARIDFPLPTALTDAETLRVRGKARDADGIASVRVNGILASTVNGFATWWVDVPLELGENVLRVETLDLAGNFDPSAAQTVVRRDGVIVRRPNGLALDPASGTCFVFDWVPDGYDFLPKTRIVAADLETGELAVVSSSTKGSGPLPSYASGEMEFDTVAGRLLALDVTHDSLLAVDLTTGDRTVLSGGAVGSGPPLVSVTGLELDLEHDRAWVFNQSFGPGSGALLGVNLTSGARWVVSSPAVGSGPWPKYQRMMQRVPGGNRLLVPCYIDDVLLGIDLGTGDRAILSDVTSTLGAPWSHIWSVAALPGGRAWVSSVGDGRLFALDVASGKNATIAAPPPGEEGALMDLKLDAGHDRLLVADDMDASLLALDLKSGAIDVALRNWIGSGVEFRRSMVRGTAVNAAGRVLVTDASIGELVDVDLASGVRTLVSGSGVGGGPELSTPIDVAFDESTGVERALVLDSGLGGVVAVDLSSGDRSLVSGPGVGVGPALHLDPSSPLSMKVSGGVGWVMDSSFDPFGGRLLAVDLATGDRRLVSGEGVGAGRPLIFSYDFDVDPAGGRALAISLEELVTIDLASGDRTLFSGAAVGAGPEFNDPVLIAWDAQEQRALVYGVHAGLFSVDGSSGDRVLFAHFDPSKGPRLVWPMSMALWRPDASGEPILFLGDHELTALTALDLAVDPSSGAVPACGTIVAR